jgi:formylglycine-generating enzyme required for sulfatase activity/uncharacterized caspase-like protein
MKIAATSRLFFTALFIFMGQGPFPAHAEPRGIMVSPSTGVTVGTIWGVFVGVSQYETPQLNLRYADKDAKALHGFFTDHFQGTVPDDHFLVLLNQEVTRGNFLRTVGEVLRRAQPEDVIVISLAMHGLLDATGQDLFFLTYDTDPNLPEAQGISRYDLLRQIDRSKARKILLLLDACHTGAFAASKSMLARRSTGAFDVNRLLHAMGEAQDGVAVLSSSSAAEFSQEGEQFCGGHGAFTCGLLTGLQGEADTNRNGVIELRELFDHTYRAVKDKTENNQHPSIEGRYDNTLPLAYSSHKVKETKRPVPLWEGNLESYNKLDEQTRYFENLDRAWKSVEGYAQTSAISSEDRLSAVNQFLQDFPTNNPHQAEAHALVEKIRHVPKTDQPPKSAPTQVEEHLTKISEPVLEARVPTVEPPMPDMAAKPSGEQSQTLVQILGGTFWMGSAPDETCEWDSIFKVEFCLPERNADYAPRHQVTLKGFWLDSHEVTNQEFERFVQTAGYTGHRGKTGTHSALIETSSLFFGKKWKVEKVDQADWKHPFGLHASDSRIDSSLPVVQLSWYDAQAYCQWQGKRLPTEAEWEYAGRAGTTTRHWWGEGNPDQARVANLPDASLKIRLDLEPVFPTYNDGSSRLATVGSYAPNAWGLYDMAGNVWEWTADWYDMAYYQRSPEVNPLGASGGTERVKRGGSWLQYKIIASREKQAPENSDDQTGFRCAKDQE